MADIRTKGTSVCPFTYISLGIEESFNVYTFYSLLSLLPAPRPYFTFASLVLYYIREFRWRIWTKYR
jgi:hypothetical protein